MVSQSKVNKTVISLLIILLAAGFFIRLDFFIAKLHDFNIVGDAKNYLIMSRQIVDNGVYGYALGQKSGTPNAYVTPGYPLLLAAAYAAVRDPYLQVTIIRFLQVVISGIISPLLSFLFVRRLFKRNGIALITALFIAIYPTYILSSTYILTEVCSFASMLLYLYLQTVSLQDRKPLHGLLAGLAFALNILIRPTMLPLLVLPFIFALFVWKKTDRMILLRLFSYTVIGAGILMLPWWIRNIVTIHRFILLSTGSGDPLLAGTYPYMTGLFQDYLGEKARVSEAAFARKRIVEGFLNEPLLYMKWYTVGKLGYLFDRPWIYWRGSPSVIGWLTYKSHYFLHYFFIRIGIIGTITGLIRRSSTIIMTSAYALSFLSLLLIFIPERRYSYHIMFFLMLSSSYAICCAASLLKRVRDRWALRYKQVKPV